jgi:hypothetical protein
MQTQQARTETVSTLQCEFPFRFPEAGPATAGEDFARGVRVGQLVGWTGEGEPLVDFEGNPLREPLPARTTVSWAETDVGREAVLMFEQGDVRRPILLGLLWRPQGRPEAVEVKAKPAEIEKDGERLEFTAEKEIVFRCGAASITLTRAGKVLIRGAYLLSRSSGVNRIKGGSVQIN